MTTAESSASRQSARFFANPWWVVFGAVVGLVFGSGAVVTFTFSLFLKPMAAEFGWNRGTLSAGLTAFQIVGAFATPFAGRLADYWGVRRATLFFVTIFSASVATLSVIPAHRPVFLLLYGLCGLAGSGQAPPAYAKAIASWFDENRGLALGIGTTGVGFGTALLPQVARFLIARFGWRDAYLGMGMMTFVAAFSVVFFCVRERTPLHSSEMRDKRVHDREQERNAQVNGYSLSEAAKGSHAFWYLTASIFLVSTVTNGFLAHVAPMLTDEGFSQKIAATALTVAGVTMILGKIFSGVLTDYLFAPYVSAFFFLSALPGILLFRAGSSLVFPLLGITFVGLSLGSVVTLQSFLVGAYFGMRYYAGVSGYFMGVLLVGGGIGSWIMGFTFDLTRSYHFAIAAFSIGLVVSAVCAVRLGPYVFATKTTANLERGKVAPHSS